MSNVNFNWEYNTLEDIARLPEDRRNVCLNLLKELKDNPYKQDWDKKYRFHRLKYDKYKGNTIFTLTLALDKDKKTTKHRLAYSIDPVTKELVIINVLNTLNHYEFLNGKKVFSDTLRCLRSMCTNNIQKRAFNELLKSFMFNKR